MYGVQLQNRKFLANIFGILFITGIKNNSTRCYFCNVRTDERIPYKSPSCYMTKNHVQIHKPMEMSYGIKLVFPICATNSRVFCILMVSKYRNYHSKLVILISFMFFFLFSPVVCLVSQWTVVGHLVGSQSVGSHAQ